jgi:effector-binding domain-containing protein
MSQSAEIVEVQPLTLAVAEMFVKRSEIPQHILKLFDAVYAWTRATGTKPAGHNYAVYDQFCDTGMRMRAGVPVAAPFADTPTVKCMQLEGGKAAHTTHRGPYSEMHVGWSRVHEFCEAQSLQQAGISWELYGDWNDDPSKLLTDIYVKLK